MNTDERSILEGFLNQLIQVRGVNKDPEAERLIQQAFERQPDAPYLLVQRALLLSQALEQAKARMAELEQQQSSGRGFLDPGASGWAPAGTQASSSQISRATGQPIQGGQPPQYGMPPSGYGYPPGAPPPGYAYAGASPPPGYGYPPGGPGMGGGFSSFLGQAAATAAGVAGGEFLFEGIENLLGHHPGMGFAGQPTSSFPTEEVTVNNYYYPEEYRPDNMGHSGQEPPIPDNDTFTDDNILADDNPLNDDDGDFV